MLAEGNEDALHPLVEEITGQGGQAVVVVTDVGNEEDVDRIARTAITQFGHFDTWVNNAGGSIFGRCEEVTIPGMQRMFATNFWGTVCGSPAAVKHYREQGSAGALINIGSFFRDRATPAARSRSSQHTGG